MTRQGVSLKPPPDDARRLEGFPRSTLDPRTTLLRVVREGNGPWWFSCSMAGRFDLSEPRGTCYLATDELTAVLEVFGPHRAGGVITTEALDRRRLHELRVFDVVLQPLDQLIGLGISLGAGTLAPLLHLLQQC